jgi:hypothetical protein
MWCGPVEVSETMLESLESVRWIERGHAFGSAEDTPENIRALLDADPRIRDGALDELWNTLCHQGTVYDASAPAVPFLLEVAAFGGAANRESLLTLIACIQDGTAPAGGDGEVAVACRAAVRAELEALKSLLLDKVAGVRAWAARLVAACAPSSGEAAGELLAALSAESDDDTRGSQALAVGLVAGEAGFESLTGVLRSATSTRTSYCAAMALCRSMGDSAPGLAGETIQEESEDLDALLTMFEGTPWDGAAIVRYFASAIGPLELAQDSAVLSVLLDFLTQGYLGANEAEELEVALLRRHFPRRISGKLISLTDEQQELIEAIAFRHLTCSLGKSTSVQLSAAGLPATAGELAVYTGVGDKDA